MGINTSNNEDNREFQFININIIVYLLKK